MRRSLQKAVQALRQADRIVLASHINPDGDSLGSMLGLGWALTALGKEITLLSADGVPEIYRWMPGADQIHKKTERTDFDLAVVCDVGALERVGSGVVHTINATPLVMDIDHHVANGAFGAIRLLDARSASTAEIVWRVVLSLERAARCTLRSREMAECLMTGIITDTGSFRYLNVTPETFRTAARLQRLGAVPAFITDLVYENRSLASIQLLGRSLSSIRRSPDGRIAWAHVTARDFAETGATDEDTEGIVNHVRAIRGTEIGILFREIPGRKVRISLRGRDGADVNRVAAAFGGGGHRLAAGCNLDPPLEDVEERVVAEASLHLA